MEQETEQEIINMNIYKSILDIKTYLDLFQEVEKISKSFVKIGDDLFFYTETGDKYKVTDVNVKVDVISIFNLYVKVAKLIQNGMSMEEADALLKKGEIQDQTIDELYTKYADEQKKEPEEETKGVRKLTIKTLDQYDELEDERIKGYRNEREKETYLETLNILASKEYQTKCTNIMDVALVLKAADSLNLYGEIIDYKQLLLSNPSFFSLLANFETMEEEDRIKLFDHALKGINLKQIKPLKESEKTHLEHQNDEASEYLKEKTNDPQKAKKIIDKIREIVLKANNNNNRLRIKGIITDPRKVALMRIIAHRNGFDIGIACKESTLSTEIKLFQIDNNIDIIFEEDK